MEEDLSDLRFLRMEQVQELFPVSRMTIYRLIKDGKFPAPRKLGGRSVWRYAKVRDFVDRLDPPEDESDDDLI